MKSSNTSVLALGVLTMLAGAWPASPALAVSSTDPDPGTTVKPVPVQQSQHKPPVDLEQQAKERRPGQVLPGDAPPASQGASSTAAVIPAAPTKPAPIPLPETTQSASANAAPPTAVVATAAPKAEVQRPKMVEPRMDAGVVASPPSPSGYSSSRVRVLQAGSGTAEWRAQVGGWQPISTDQTAESRVEVRAGLDSDVVLAVDDMIQLRVGRLGRVTIERATEPDGSTTVSLILGRGAIDVMPLPGANNQSASKWLARVRSPDRSVALTSPAHLTYDAFAGTRVRVLSNTSR